MNIDSVCAELKDGASLLSLCTAQQKNNALESVKQSLLANKQTILQANQKDVDLSRSKGVSEALIERLALDDKKFASIIQSIDIIISQTDPIGEETAGWKTPGGLEITQVRVPLGVVAIIYESRPNVTVDAFALAYKSGNAILLRGSSSALNSNQALTDAIIAGLKNAGKDGISNAIYLCPSTDHSDVDQILNANGKIDVVLPRGGSKLINTVVQNAHIPVIQTGAGICHLYVDQSADLDKAVAIAVNAKVQRPGACNAIETLLVNKNIMKEFLPKLAKVLDNRVELRAEEDCFEILKPYFNDEASSPLLKKACPEDFGYEFLDFILAIKSVENTEEAIAFINNHNTKHSEAIVTENRTNARLFQSKIDAACVYVNASTRFTDGGEFGFGAELGISTQKLHARGPMGIKALTTTKYLIDGDGQTR